jgi:CelD/BcsL family acetyltransferase involved in cellulose biosynthesis
MTEDILRPTMLFPPAERPRLFASLTRYLAANANQWDVLELDELADTDAVIDSAREVAASMQWLYRETPFHPCPSLDLASRTWSSYFGERSTKLRKNMRAAERRLEEVGTVGLQVYRTPAEIARGFETFRALALASWKHGARIGMASDPRYDEFYADLLGVFAERNGARVLVLTASGTPVAATLAMIFDNVYYSLQIVHDEVYARCSPGTLLEARELEALFVEGVVERYEFMGGALSNKLRWTDEAVDTVCVRLARADLRWRALERYGAVKRVAKRVLRAARAATATRSESGDS